MIKFVITAAMAFAVGLAIAQSATPAPPAPAPVAKEMADAEIRKFDKDAKKITLKHGPIKSLDMPGMTMVFQVQDAALLDKLTKLAVGDKIKFSAEQVKGAYIVTDAVKVPGP
jgi:Cu(I)/Ag(I) efflux system periplasmic protein CusF